MIQNNYVVIMAGGIGSRFWPMSRTQYPKQFHDILGTGQTLLQQTAARYHNIAPQSNIYVVTNKDYDHLVKAQLPWLSEDQILLEPVGRNTAPCVAYAITKIGKQNPDANIVVAPSDHVILKEEQFERTILAGLAITAAEDVLLTLGIQPSRPDTGYGYIQYLPTEGSVHKKVKTFTEKPNAELAQSFIESGDFVWNAGIFIWNQKAVSAAISKYLPEVAEIFEEGLPYYYTGEERNFINKAYTLCKNISVDYGVMEKSSNVFTLLSDFGWSDLGTWKSLYDISDKDNNSNVIDANTLLYQTTNCIIKSTSKEKLIVVNGLDGYIVAESNGVVMICPIADEQKVKDFVTDVKAGKEKRFT